jgi:hypothetical protein
MPGKRGRHAKKAGGRATPKGTQPSGRLSAHVRAIFADAAEAVHDDPVDAEGFASSFQQVFRLQGGPRPDEVLREALRVGGLVGLYVARSIAVFGPPEARARGESVYGKIAAKSPPPRWLSDMGNVTVGEVALVRDEYGDGHGVYLEYHDPLSGDLRTIGVYIDVNMGMIAKDVIDGPPLAALRELVTSEPQIEIVAIDPAEARARVEAAFFELDEEPELDLLEDLEDLRALAEQRFSLLPAGGVVPDESSELSEDEVQELLDAFVASPHFFGLLGPAREIGEVICDFAVEGRTSPLRWSPVVVEIFLVHWMPSEVVADRDFLLAVPDVLRAWIRFAGERRALAADLIDETVQSIDQWLDEYHAAVELPEGGATAIVAAMVREGVDLEDERAVQAFIDEYHAGLSEVDVDLDRAEERLLAQWRAFEAQLVDVMKSSLATLRGIEQPPTLGASADAVRAGLQAGRTPFAEAAALNDWSEADAERLGDVELVSAVATAWFEPSVDLPELDDALAQANAIDHTDLLRVVLALASEGPGAAVVPERLAQLLEADDPADLDLARDVFERYLRMWRAIDVVDDAGHLTALGQWLLPRAFARRWGGDFDR